MKGLLFIVLDILAAAAREFGWRPRWERETESDQRELEKAVALLEKAVEQETKRRSFKEQAADLEASQHDSSHFDRLAAEQNAGHATEARR